MQEGESITKAFARGLRAGTKPSSITVMDLFEPYRLYVNRWFYECYHTLHAGLRKLDASDSRFRCNYDKYE